eukprot:2218656-Prymnesium_polylepis.1
MEQLREMGDAVPERQRAPDYQAALDDTAVVIGDLRLGMQPEEAAREDARAVIAGMLPTPTAA